MGSRASNKALPTRERLLELFDYGAESGDLFWRAPRQGLQNKTRAGTITTRGYRSIKVDGGYYYAHRLIWKIETGIDPAEQIDHIDGNRDNNRFDNLRPATNSQNRCNARLGRNNVSGVKGVCWEPDRKRWLATISVGGKQKKLGRFHNLNEAAAAVDAARTILHGQFARAA